MRQLARDWVIISVIYMRASLYRNSEPLKDCDPQDRVNMQFLFQIPWPRTRIWPHRLLYAFFLFSVSITTPFRLPYPTYVTVNGRDVRTPVFWSFLHFLCHIAPPPLTYPLPQSSPFHLVFRSRLSITTFEVTLFTSKCVVSCLPFYTIIVVLICVL